MTPKYSIVTGASSGIGLEIARDLARRGGNLVLVARRIENLSKISNDLSSQYKITCEIFQSDLSLPGEAERLKKFCEEKNLPIDCLVNNAGIGTWGPFESVSAENHLKMIDLNIKSLTELTHVFYPLLKKQNSWVMNVASTAAFQAIPTFSSYAASKSYVLSFSRALAHEWRSQNITVTALNPGPTKSEFTQHAKLSHVDKLAATFEASAESVARRGVEAMLAGKIEVTPGFLNYWGSRLAQFSPRVLNEWISGKFFR